MKVLGITGGVGMGKSTCAELITSRGLPVVDTDDLSRQVVEPGEPALAEIEKSFGPGMLDDQGRLRRDLLGNRVFSDANARQHLEAILHPRIRALWRARAQAWADEGLGLGFVVIPLLFETHAEKELDGTVCVACSAATQRERLIARGWTCEEAARRVGAQLPVEAKVIRSGFVIWTEGSLEVHAAQLDRVLATLSVQFHLPLLSCTHDGPDPRRTGELG